MGADVVVFVWLYGGGVRADAVACVRHVIDMVDIPCARTYARTFLGDETLRQSAGDGIQGGEAVGV